jgi:dienelactone hydrolase
MSTIRASMRVGMIMTIAVLFAAEGPAPAVFHVSGQGFVADFYSSPGSETRIGIMVLGGAEGGMPTWALPLTQAGYPVLNVAYFQAEGRPDSLEEIGLEYFDKPMAWLASGGRCRPGGIILAGASKGAEAALLLASRRTGISAVIAMAPSSVVWQATPKPYTLIPAACSSWNENGDPIPFLPFDYSAARGNFNLWSLHQASLLNADAVQAASIPVEKIRAPILVFSGAEDGLWPSSEMGEAIVARLSSSGFAFAFTHVSYPQAGHVFSGEVREGNLIGGTLEGNRAAHADCWEKIFGFLKNAEGTGHDS